MSTTEKVYQKCINPDCGAEFDCGQSLFKCPECGDLLDIWYNWDKNPVPKKLKDFAKRWATRNQKLDFSGVWRFRELLNFCEDLEHTHSSIAPPPSVEVRWEFSWSENCSTNHHYHL